MADHAVDFELFYDGVWNGAPVLTRGGMKFRRGITDPGNDTDPAVAPLTLDGDDYAPRSVVSPLYGKIGQNTRGRISVDGDVRMVGEVAEWRPERPIKGTGWSRIQLAGVLRRMGRGTDPIQTAPTRAVTAAGAVYYWPLTDGKDATAAASGLANGPALTVSGTPKFAEDEGPIPGSSNYVRLIEDSTNIGGLSIAPSLSGAGWAIEGGFAAEAPAGDARAIPATWTMSGDLGDAQWTLTVRRNGSAENVILTAYANESTQEAALTTGGVGGPYLDGSWHHWRVTAHQDSPGIVTLKLFVDGVERDDSTLGTFTMGVPTLVRFGAYNNDFVAGFIPVTNCTFMAVGEVAVYGTDTPDDTAAAFFGHAGETAADRFSRFCAEEGLTAVVVGDPAESVVMGAQHPLPRLEIFDEIARTDDALIFETRDDMGLTMRTGASRLNQTTALTVSYLGEIQPPLLPEYGDRGIRNDVTAASPSGSTRRVEQTTGPHNVQLPEDDPQGVGRYQTRIDVNPATDDALGDAAGWRVNLGTYAGTWYAAITADLDAAPGIASAVAAVDIGDVVALEDLPVSEALDTVESIVIGIEEDLPHGGKRRLVTFYTVPADPYRVGVLSATSGDTDPVVGHLDTDGSTTTGTVSAGATSFSVATPSGPLWTTVADDFPFDVIVGGQRVSISSISGGSSPQTFTVKSAVSGGRQVVYPIAAGAAVNVQQPVILVL